jgi:hypothetical protein
MNTVERIAFAVMLLVGGVALGMYIEHERFLKEIQGAVKEHAKEPPPSKADAAT